MTRHRRRILSTDWRQRLTGIAAALTLVGALWAGGAVVGPLAASVPAAGLALVGNNTPVNFDGDNYTDFTVVRNTTGQPSGPVTWYMLNSLGFSALPFGIATDFFVAGDYEGDGKSDVMVWRPGMPAVFYRLNSSNGAFVMQPFGQTGDDPTVAGDYDGDGRWDYVVYRSGSQSVWHILRSSNGVYAPQPWGQAGDFPAPGDYDGDGRHDTAVQRNIGGQGVFFINRSTDGLLVVYWGTPSDAVVPGDYDGDGKTDVAVARGQSGTLYWYIFRSSDGGMNSYAFGLYGIDLPVQGDYDGDGRTDVAIWRNGVFYGLKSSDGSLIAQAFGQAGDYPVANFNVH